MLHLGRRESKNLVAKYAILAFLGSGAVSSVEVALPGVDFSSNRGLGRYDVDVILQGTQQTVYVQILDSGFSTRVAGGTYWLNGRVNAAPPITTQLIADCLNADGITAADVSLIFLLQLVELS